MAWQVATADRAATGAGWAKQGWQEATEAELAERVPLAAMLAVRMAAVKETEVQWVAEMAEEEAVAAGKEAVAKAKEA